jgi:hypothetical protein
MGKARVTRREMSKGSEMVAETIVFASREAEALCWIPRS